MNKVLKLCLFPYLKHSPGDTLQLCFGLLPGMSRELIFFYLTYYILVKVGRLRRRRSWAWWRWIGRGYRRALGDGGNKSDPFEFVIPCCFCKSYFRSVDLPGSIHLPNTSSSYLTCYSLARARNAKVIRMRSRQGLERKFGLPQIVRSVTFQGYSLSAEFQTTDSVRC